MKETENWQPRTQIKLDGVEFERQGVLPITKTFLADCTHNLAYGHNIAAMYEFWKCIERMFPFDLVNEDNDSIKKYNQYLRINYVINKERYDSLCTLDSEKYESDLETYLTHCTNEKLRKLMFNEMSAFCFRYPNNAGLSFLIEDINILIAGSEYTLKSLREFKEGLISNSQTLSYNFFYPTADGRCFWGIHLDQKGVFKWFHIVNIRTQMQNYLDWLLDLRQTIDKIIQPQPATPPVGEVESGQLKEGTATQPVGEEKKEELSHAQTALFHIYTQSPITKNNAQQIAESRGQTSGQKLHDRYKKMGKSLAERTSSRFAVTDIEKVMTLLSDPKQLKMAEDELKVAKSLRNK